MADVAPVIDSLTSDVSTLNPGETATLTVDAHDADARTVDVSVRVTDTSGGEVTGTLQLTITDPLTFTWTSDDPNVVLTPSADGKSCAVAV